ncbi:hypothetical protein [Pseudomonas sp. EA_35y_Pfl2_R111]|uniref:hypothetical protein n=1 Tax=Pseudomonas sp. EA_35y_Pfl2_R111 TaxID=3088689 RepID=UPI0030D819DF
MADSKPINWAYPFKTAGESSKEVTDPQLYFDALAKAENGFYPMGANGLWHGGVHFDANTGALLDQSQVRCIADGEVIAYRIDDKYPETPYAATNQPGMGPEPVGAKYSTGFVLIKHRLVIPEPPAPATNGESSGAEPAPVTSAGATTPTATATDTAQITTPDPAAAEPEGLTFYSLYMHLLDWAGYQATNAPKPPEFIAPTRYAVKDTTSDAQLGLRVRASPSGGTTQVLALLPKGCTVTLGEASTTNPSWKQLLSVDGGAAIPALPADTIGWVYASELTNNTVADLAKDSEPTLTLSHQGLNVRKEGKRTGAIIGVLPRGAILNVGEKLQSGYCKVLEVMDYRDVPALPNGPDGKPLGYVYFGELNAQQTAPSDLGLVHLLPEPHSIKAGELIGHIGRYQDQGDGTAQPRLHLEVFSCDDVPAFITKSRTLAASLPADQKTLLKIHKGASKLIPHNDAINASNPPTITDTGVTIAVELTLPVSVLENLPAERKIQVSETLPGSPTPHITSWWRLDNLLADDADNRISGWLAEQDMITTRHSPWEWEGFDFISETTCAADHLACHFAAQRLLTEEEKPDYQAQISTADHGPIKERLYDIIDGADGSVRDNILSVTEIKSALKKTWHAQSISRLITHYESEWFWQDAKWDELDKLMQHTEEDQNPQWVKEKERIKKLCLWRELTGKQGINTDGKVWHFHVLALLENFSSNGCKCKNKLTKEQLRAIAPHASSTNIDLYIDPINEMFDKFKIDHCISRAHVLAQMLHESGSMNFVTEGLNSNDPLPAYHPYIGRGLLQITWETNYRTYGNYMGENFIGHPHYLKMSQPPHCVVSVGWFWSEFKNLNRFSDKDDFIYITYLINGGFNGYDHRLSFINSAIQELKISACSKLNFDGFYKLEDSEAYNKAKPSFAWGLWSDPGSSSSGKTKDKAQAIAGYSRYIEIYNTTQSVRDDTTTKYYSSTRRALQAKEHAEQRIEILRNS